jgi:hypothetical protein
MKFILIPFLLNHIHQRVDTNILKVKLHKKIKPALQVSSGNYFVLTFKDFKVTYQAE